MEVQVAPDMPAVAHDVVLGTRGRGWALALEQCKRQAVQWGG